MTKIRTPHIENLPAGLPFARELAMQLLENCAQNPDSLAEILIFLPTKRAARILTEAFLRENSFKPLLLPRIQTLGDIDEEELSLTIAGQQGSAAALNIPPGMPLLKRRLILAQIIQARPEYAARPDHALALAGALGELIDHIHNENLRLQDLRALVPENFADHWQITLDFLKILSEHWPQILHTHRMIDMADRRNRLLLALAAHWEKHPPQTPVIAAGSTGSIPAAAKLLGIIARLPRGRIILPGFDENIDQESWEALGETHPQYGFKHLLSAMNAKRTDIRPWISVHDTPVAKARRALAGELMRPSETTQNWKNLTNGNGSAVHFPAAFENLSVLKAAHERDEADLIAALLRETLETPDKTAVLITPDRLLARRVTAAARRWNIVLDDSAGQPLNQTALGRYLLLYLQACRSGLAPVALLAFLKHPLCNALPAQDIANLEEQLRGPRPAPGFEGLKQRLQNHPQLLQCLQKLEPPMQRFATLAANGKEQSLKQFVETHLTAAESLAGQPLWTKEEGRQAAGLFAEWLGHEGIMNKLTFEHYALMTETLMRSITVRPAYGTHPRLKILGQLEARLIDADRVILGGLNEGVWPPDSGHDPWMSRPMRKNFGLPGIDRSIGLAAHDFVQGFCAPEVIITHAARRENAPSIPARWLQRLDAILKAANLPADSIQSHPVQNWVRNLDRNRVTEPAPRPQPRPPVHARPRHLSVTKIEKWLQDPYAIYASEVLNLKKKDPLEELPGAALQGDILHRILQRFVSQHGFGAGSYNPDELYTHLYKIAESVLAEQPQDPSLWQFWWPRFERLARWFLNHESTWRETFTDQKTEIRGEVMIDSLTLTARADRIDTGENGSAIIDYKSAGTYAQSAIRSCKLPQLPLEALMLEKGGFEFVPAMTPSTLGYWVLTGGNPPGKIVQVDNDLQTLLKETEAGLKSLIAAFGNPETPYHAVPNPEFTPHFSDTQHLARTAEWGNLGEDDTQTEAA